MAKNPIVVKTNNTLSSLELMNIGPKDTAIIKISAGAIDAHVKKPSGEVLSISDQANGALRQLTQFDPSKVSIQERRQLELDMSKKGRTQAEIANLLGMSQPTVSVDLRKIRRKKAAN